MNDNHSKNESYYKKRWIADQLRTIIGESPVVVVTGARQVGKSTLLRNESPFSTWKYLTLDDLSILDQAKKDPASLWMDAREIILDEVQKAPEILSAVKAAVDRDRNLRFVLSGSANLLLMRSVAESLAGRAIYIYLNPMTLGEERGKPAPILLQSLLRGERPPVSESIAVDPIPLMHRGFLPPLSRLKDEAAIVRWWDGYVTTYLERDLRQLSQIDALPDFRRVMDALALRTGQIINQTEISRDVAVSQPSVHRYINLLATTNLLERVPAFSSNRTTRLIKSPKYYWLDPGLTAFLTGCFDTNSLRTARNAGGIFESLVILHLQVLAQLMTPRARISYWRPTTGQEVDFVIEHGRRVLPIEVKLSSKPSYSDAANLRFFLDRHPEAEIGLVIHGGNKTFNLDERIVALPWTAITGV